MPDGKGQVVLEVQIKFPTWEASNEGNGWRARNGTVVDGRLFDTEAECLAYCDGIYTGWHDAVRRIFTWS